MGRSREEEDVSALSRPMLGEMTGGSSGEHHLDFKPVDTSKTEDALRAAETACQLAIQQIPQEVEVSQELLIYPEGERGAVTITDGHMEELLPERFLGDEIVDFYIRFLQRRLPPEHGKLFYFFTSFFFTKLLQSTAPTRIDPFKLDYEQIRKWTEEVNLFEKDYVFIPIVESSHWSLVILCNLSSVTRAPDEMTRFPCIVHLDPVKGQHESFEGLIRSYVLEAWMDRFQPSIDKDQLRALYQMKYIQAEVPQQDNSYDCGLYVLQYIESFLVESTSLDFSFASSERGPHFTGPHFAAEVLSKRSHIQNLVLELSGIYQERAGKRKAIKHLVQELMQTSQKLRVCLEVEGNSKGCTKDMLTANPTIFNGRGCEIDRASIHEDSMYTQHLQSSEISRGNNEPLSGPQIRPMEYENRCEHLLLSQEQVGPKVQTIGPTNFNSPIFEDMHASTHEDAMDVRHQQSSKISRLDYEPLDGLELGHVEFRRVTKSFLDKHQHLEIEEVPCVELSEALKGKNKRGRNMSEEETSILLSCKVEGGRFCKGSGGATYWNLISEEIGRKVGSLPSADQCRLRYDTLKKAYETYKKYCMKTGKTFSEITEEERLDLKLATILSKEWYTTIGKICDKVKSYKRIKINPGVCNDSLALDIPPISNGRSFEDAGATLDSACGAIEVALRNVFPTSVLSSLNEDLQSTLLNLVQECSLEWFHLRAKNGKVFNLEYACRRLAILQDCEPREILASVFKLWKLDFVNVMGMVFEQRKDIGCIDLWKDKTWYLKRGLFEKISKKVLCKNPHLKIYCYSFPIEQSSLQYIRVLKFYRCIELQHLELGEFPNLRSFAIHDCPNFKLVTGWELATSLGSLEIMWCNAFHGYLNVQHLFSLREISIGGWRSNEWLIPWQLFELRQCAKLQRVEIQFDRTLSVLADFENLKELKSLEFLSLVGCPFSSIQGLSKLQALTTLNLQACRNLRRLELGCFKRLTVLDMSYTSVEDVAGVGELHLLIWLNLHGCTSLKWLPFLGHLRALVHLDLGESGVKEILGREDLISLKTLYLGSMRTKINYCTIRK